MNVTNWEKLECFINSELDDAKDDYESVLEKELEIILKYMDELKEQNQTVG